MSETCKQYSVSDTVSIYVLILYLQESIYTWVPQTCYMSDGEARQHVVDVLAFSIHAFQGIQDQRYNKIVYLIDYIAYGIPSWYAIQLFQEMCRKPIV